MHHNLQRFSKLYATLTGTRPRQRTKLMKPWIVAFIQKNPVGELGNRAEVVKVTNICLVCQSCTKKNISGAKKGECLKHVADGEIYIKARFSENAVKQFQAGLEDESQTDWNSSMIILQQFTLEFEPHAILAECQYVLVVEKFKLWDLQEGFSRKNNNLQFCMDHDEVKTKAEEEWCKGREERLDSIPLSQLLAEMAYPSSEDNTAQSIAEFEQSDQHTDSISDSLLRRLYRPFTMEEFQIKEKDMKILSELTDWKTDYRPSPAPSNEENSSSQSEFRISSVNTLAADNPARKRVVALEVDHDAREKVSSESKALQISKSQQSQTSKGQQSQMSGYSQADSALWQQDLDSVHFSCSDESLDFGSPKAQSTQVEARKKRSHRSGKSFKNFNYVGNRNNNSSVEYLGIVTQPSVEHLGSCAPLLNHDSSSSVVIVETEKKVERDNIPRVITIDSSKEGSNGDHIRLESSGSSPSILKQNEKSDTMSRQSEQKNVMIHIVEVADKGNISPTRENEKEVSINNDCVFQNRTDVHPELSLNFSSDKSVISPSPEAEVSHLSQLSLVGNVSRMVSNRITKSNTEKNALDQSTNAQVELDAKINVHGTSLIASTTEQQSYEREPSLSLRPYTLMQDKSVLNQMFYVQLPSVTQESKTDMSENNSNVEWQDDIAVNSESHYGDSQKDPAEISVEGLFDQRKHVNRMNKLSGHQGCAKVVKENITENSPTDLLIKGDLQDAENELRHSTDTSFENSLEQEKSVLQEYYSQKDSPRCKVNKDSLLDRANSFKTMSRIPVDIQNNDVNTNELGGINVNGQKQNQIRAKTGMSVVNYFKNNKANRSKINTNSLILREKRNKTKTTSARKQKQLTACYKRRKSPRLVKREGTDKSQRVSSHSDKREPLIQKEKESVVHKTGVTSIMSQKGKMNVGYCDVSNSSNKRVKRNTENYDVDDSSSEQSISGDTGDSNKIQNITVRELDSSEDSSLESKKEEKEVDLEMSECPSNLDASFPVRQIIPEPNRNFEKSRNIKQTKPSTEWEANFYEWTKNYKETGCNQYSCLCCQDSNAVASVVVDSSTSTNINSDFTSKNVINMKTVHEQSVSDGSYLDIGNSAHSNSKLSRSETDEGNGLKNSSLNVHISSESKLVERNSELDKSPVMSHKNLENNTLYDSRNITSVKRTIDSANTASDKTRTPIPCATQSDTLERTSYIFRKTSSPKQSNSDESVESAGSPDLLTGTLPFDTEHLMVKPHQEAPMPDILTGTQKFDTVYSQTQGFVPNLSSTLRTLSSSSNELSLLNASEENKTDRLLSPESIPQEARLCSLNKNSVSNIKTQNIMLKRLPREYSVELEAEQQRLESLSKPGSKGVAIQSEMITATAKNDSMSRLDPLLHENTNDNDIVVISSDSSNETVPDFVVKETGSSVHNKLESLNSNLSTETTAHQTTDNILGEESQHSRYTCGNNKYNSTESEMEVISFVSKNGKSSTDLKIEKEETQKSKCKNIWLSSHFIRQFDLSTVTVIPLKKNYSKEKLQRLSNVKKIYKEKRQHESKTSTLKVKPIYKSNRKTLFERQSSSKSLVELTDESSDTESVVKFDLEKHKNLKTYEPQKMIIDGHNFGNKNMWMNIEKSPYPQLSKLNQKNSQRGTSDFTRKDLPMSGSVHSDASLIGKEGLVRKEVDGMFRFYRKPTQNHTKDSRVNTKDTADKVSKNTSVDTKENGESLQSLSYVTDKRKSRTENHLNHSETVSQRNMKGIVSTSLDKNLGGNEKGMPKKEKEEKGIPELFKCNIDIPEHSTTEGKISNKRKLDDIDGSSTNCKIMRLRTNLHGQKQTTQNDRGTFDLPKQLSHLTDSLFLEDAASEKRERKKKYMEGLGLRNFFTQEWIEKQAFEVKSSEDSQTSSSQSQHVDNSLRADESRRNGSKIDQLIGSSDGRNSVSRSTENQPGHTDWEKMWSSLSVEPASEVGKNLLQLQLQQSLKENVEKLLKE